MRCPAREPARAARARARTPHAGRCSIGQGPAVPDTWPRRVPTGRHSSRRSWPTSDDRTVASAQVASAEQAGSGHEGSVGPLGITGQPARLRVDVQAIHLAGLDPGADHPLVALRWEAASNGSPGREQAEVEVSGGFVRHVAGGVILVAVARRMPELDHLSMGRHIPWWRCLSGSAPQLTPPWARASWRR